MFFELSKALHFILTSPISWMAVLVALAFAFRSRRKRAVCVVTCLVLFLLSTNGVLFNIVNRSVTAGVQQPTCDVGRRYRAAIVLGGFSSVNSISGRLQFVEDRADRLWEAVRLWRTGVVERILITGDPASFVNEDGRSSSCEFLAYMEAMGVPSDVFILEQHALNTHQNAVNTVKILAGLGIDSRDCVLITSAIHMRRALSCFEHEGFPTDYLAVGLPEAPSKLGHRAFYPDWSVAEKWSSVINEWIGCVAYRIVGYI